MEPVTERTEQTFAYVHKVQYYETDAMQIVHHSNYIRWMEEARLEHLGRVGLAYDKMEAKGIIIPVLSASCEYKAATRYGETVKVFLDIEKFNGLKFSVVYKITSEDESVVHATGRTSHCFLNREMKPVNIKKTAPDIYDFFKNYKPSA